MVSNASRPRVGLPTYVEQARWGAWDRRAALLPTTYLDAVAGAGGVPVMLPPIATSASSVIDMLDAVVLTGGADIEPACYGACVDEATTATRPDRDRWETDLLRLALERDLPVLAICRGMQLLDVVLGGTLHQHLPRIVGHEGHRPGVVHVKVHAGSRLASILGDEAEVTCHHHQAVDRLGDGLTVVANADDGTVEAVELAGHRFVVGVQWHPEDGADPRLFEAVIGAV